MVTRSECLYKNEYLGIETLYTVIQEKQINIPEKLEWFREKSRNNELFCPCGCGANLTVVAGEKGLRDQHFRIKKGSQSQTECTYIEEGKISIDSKIVLKCWLDDKIQTTDLESRVPICAIDDTKRKYEFTLLSRQKKIAVNYCHDKANLSDEKMQILDENSKGIHKQCHEGRRLFKAHNRNQRKRDGNEVSTLGVSGQVSRAGKHSHS